MDKKYIYEYIDLVDTRSKLAEIEKKGKKNDIISWKLLIDELKKNVIMNDTLKEFIQKTEKNIKFSNIYFSTINKYIDEEHDRVNEENNVNFEKMKKKIIISNIGNKNFYKIQKDYIYKDIRFINLLSKKYKEKTNINDDKIFSLLKDKINIFMMRSNVLKIFYEKNQDEITYEDDILINILKVKDFIIMEQYIKDMKKKYDPIILPKFIIIKDNNHLPVININYNIENKIKTIYMNIIMKKYKDEKNYLIYTKPYFKSYYFKTNIVYLSFYTYYKYLIYIYYYLEINKIKIYCFYIISKEFMWLIYKFYKIT